MIDEKIIGQNTKHVIGLAHLLKSLALFYIEIFGLMIIRNYLRKCDA